MPLPEPILDDLRFQKDIVDEARRRIIRYCPEWTEYNVSDPGITLIELFAWMTELITWRLNRVPEKNYIRFLDLLGVQLMPASSARVELTFRLATPFPIAPGDDTTTTIPRHFEVSTWPDEESGEVVFTTDERLVLAPPRITQLRRASNDPSARDDFRRNYLSRLGLETFLAFGNPPQEGDTFYLGFDPDHDIKGYILQLRFLCEETQATGIRRDDPPWVWECSAGDGNWIEVPPSRQPGESDTTGGLNNPDGRITFYLPLECAPAEVQGHRAYWLRCRVHQRHKAQGAYTQSPRIQQVEAYVLGATTTATHAVVVQNEMLGMTTGESGQSFHLQHVPVLEPREEETLEIEEIVDGELVFVPWQRVESFAQSSPHDRHYTLDLRSGEVRLGPMIRQANGANRQYGRVPEANRAVRFSCYRHGGGVAGNLPEHRLRVMRGSVPFVDSVTNLKRATGGRDAETLEEAKLRAQREVHAQHRAVTASDYESFALASSREVARVKCNPDPSLPPGAVELLIVPAAHDAIANGNLSALHVPIALRTHITRYLDTYRLLTTQLIVREPRYLGVKVEAEIVPHPHSNPDQVRERVHRELCLLISPLNIGRPALIPDGEEWNGWEFGRDLYIADLYALIQRVPGVRYVRDVRFASTPIQPGKGARTPEPTQSTENNALRVLHVPPDTLLCSLEHAISVVEL